ncbi:MAG: outer membrane protein assembly factor BamB family protein [Acidimicrobiia bacterium]
MPLLGVRNRKPRWSRLVLVSIAVPAIVLLGGCDWSQFRAGPAGTGYNPGEFEISPANVSTLVAQWSRGVSWTAPNVGSSAPIVRSGDDLVVASPGHSRVLDAETGAVRRAIGSAGDDSAAVTEGRVVFTGPTSFPGSYVSSFDLATGNLVWSSQAEFAATAPVVARGFIYVNSEGTVGAHSGVIWAYRASDGVKLWATGGCCAPFLAPGVANGTLYFTQVNQGSPNLLRALDASTGAPRWSVPAPTRCAQTSPIIAGGRLYVSGSTFDAATGAHLWDWPVCPATALATVSSTTVYVPYHPTPTTTELSAFDASTGAVRWSIPWGENAHGVPSAPAVANGLLFAADGSRVIAADAATGERLWESRASTGVYDEPIVSDGFVYAMSTDGRVHAFTLPSSS